MKTNELKPLQIGYGDEQYTFFLRMISIEEEELFTQKFALIADSDGNKHAKRYEIYKEALATFSVKSPILEHTGVKTELAGKDESTMDAIMRHFKERSPQNERILQYAYIMFRNQLEPSVSFL